MCRLFDTAERAVVEKNIVMAVAFCDTAHGLSEHSVGNTVDSEQFMTDGNASVGSYRDIFVGIAEKALKSLAIGNAAGAVEIAVGRFQKGAAGKCVANSDEPAFGFAVRIKQAVFAQSL